MTLNDVTSDYIVRHKNGVANVDSDLLVVNDVTAGEGEW